ncbi:amidohydrolase family protein [Amycolatopsis jejuensis]|uniref:amidohydrolase family protein n=1 Tax=Amycolatopsis jejuensis TaxID=330084 RepID=UPI000524BC1F|nr:amidohydrolase family protein [Amycolatopsis jejuensis]
MDNAAKSGRLVLRDVACVAGPELRLVPGADLVAEDGVLTAIEPTGAGGSGLVAFPGFLNCHTHIGDAAFADRAYGLSPRQLLWPPDGLRYRWMAETSRKDQVDAMRSAARQMLATGTVAFADFREQGRTGTEMLREALDGLPLRGLILGRAQRYPLHSDEELQANASGLDAARTADIASTLEVADGFSLVWANDTTDTGLAQIRALCDQHDARLAVHAGASARFRDVSRARTGASDVERVVRHLRPDFVVHMTDGTPEEFALLAEAGIPVVMCPRTQAAFGEGIPPLLTALDSGVSVALGTDNVMASGPDLLAELNFFSRVLRAVGDDVARPTATELLATVTTAAAKALRLDDTLGQLTPGYEASFFLLDLTTDNLRHSHDPVAALISRATPADIRAVVVAGQVVHGSLPPG